MSQPSADLIRGVPLFSDLDDKTIDRLAGDFIERHFPEGTAIATEGVDGLNFFIVASGEAAVSMQRRASSGRSARVHRSVRSRSSTSPPGRRR